MEQVSLLRGLGWVQSPFGAMTNQTDRQTRLVAGGHNFHLVPKAEQTDRHSEKTGGASGATIVLGQG